MSVPRVDDRDGIQFAQDKYKKYVEKGWGKDTTKIGYKFVEWCNETHNTDYEIENDEEARELGNYVVQFFLSLEYTPPKDKKKKVGHDYPENMIRN